MSDGGNQSSCEPVFKRCVRCAYSLRGLPVNHACPECGLRFDERCELYRATNRKQVLVVLGPILGSGWVVLMNLPRSFNFMSGSQSDKVGALVVVAWLLSVGFGIWFLVKQYRQGIFVAVTRDGLVIRLPGFSNELVPWENIGNATATKTAAKGHLQVVSVHFKKKKKYVDIGFVGNLFPTRADAERFAAQINERTRSANKPESA